MTIFGIDISEHQNGLSLVRARDEGISFAIIRTTDGTYRDSCYRSHVEDGKNAGLPLAAYHYLRHPAEGTSIEQQVATAVEVMGEHRLPIWLDCETPTRLSEQHVQRAKQCFEDRGIRVLGIYSYVPYWRVWPVVSRLRHSLGTYGWRPMGVTIRGTLLMFTPATMTGNGLIR